MQIEGQRQLLKTELVDLQEKKKQREEELKTNRSLQESAVSDSERTSDSCWLARMFSAEAEFTVGVSARAFPVEKSSIFHSSSADSAVLLSSASGVHRRAVAPVREARVPAGGA